jgi:hypothetical protein
MRPSCILVPKSAQEVAIIVAALQTTSDKFAVKSRGHMPNNGFASIDGGIIISLRDLNQVSYNAETGTVVAGSGQTWDHPLQGMEGTGRTVVGGQWSDIGLGGLLLGGGANDTH